MAACAEGVWPGEACPELVEGTLYDRWKRWSDKGVFIRMMEGLATPHAPERKTIIIDATPAFAGAGSISRPTARRRALGLKGSPGRLIGRTKGGMNTGT